MATCGSTLRTKALSLLIGLCFVMNVTAADWVIARGNQRLQGVTSELLPTTIKRQWVVTLGKEIKASPVVYKQKVVVSTTDGEVFCLNTSGKILWQFKTENAVEASALILDNRVFVGDLSGNLYAIDLNTGQKIWTFTAENQFMSGPNWWVQDGKTYLLAGNYDYFLYCIDASTGKQVWKYEAQNYLNATPAVENGLAIFGGCDGNLHVVDIRTGKSASVNPLATYVASSVALDRGLAYVGDYDGKVTGFFYGNKQSKWSFALKDREVPFIAAPSVTKYRVLIGCKDRFLYCLNKSNGKELWKVNMGNPVETSTITDARNVLACNMRGDMMLLSLTNGSTVWTYSLGSPVVGNPAYSNGRLYVGTYNGKLYCLTQK